MPVAPNPGIMVPSSILLIHRDEKMIRIAPFRFSVSASVQNRSPRLGRRGQRPWRGGRVLTICLLTLIGTVVTASRVESQQREPNNAAIQKRLPTGSRVDLDLVYETIGTRKLPLDLYRPQSETPTPLVIWIHGGAWKSGSKKGAGPAIALLDRGYAVASVEYRLSGEAIFPAAIEDCKAAVSFLRSRADQYNLDPDRFGVWGSSAGGHLVSLLGTTNDETRFDTHPITRQASPKVQAVCNWFGPSDFLRMNDFPSIIDHDDPGSPESLFIGGPIQEHPDLARRANPITYVSKTDPPFLHVHGSADKLVPLNQSELLHAALKQKGVHSELYVVVNGGHGFRGAEESREELAKRSIDFFDSIFKAK